MVHFFSNGFYFRWIGPLTLAALILAVGATETHGQRRLPPRPMPYSELDRMQAVETLAAIREFSLPGVCYFEFHLRVMPRRGAERLLRGRMWAARNEDGPVFRYEIVHDEDGDPREDLRMLVQNGANPAVWILTHGEEKEPAPRRLSKQEVFEPLMETDITPFDLQMPFLFWEDHAYEGLQRVRGRSSHAFLMYPPEDVAEAHSDLGGARIFVDAAFEVLTGAELVDGTGGAIKGFNIIEVKKIEENWVVKSVDVRENISGNRTRLAIRAGAVDLDPDLHSFSPEALPFAFPPVPHDRIRFF